MCPMNCYSQESPVFPLCTLLSPSLGANFPEVLLQVTAVWEGWKVETDLTLASTSQMLGLQAYCTNLIADLSGFPGDS